MRKVILVACSVLVVGAAAPAQVQETDRGRGYDNRFDRRMDRIERRLDRRSDAIDKRLDHGGEVLDGRFDK